MTKLILIRHGRTLWNSSGKFQGQSDIELSQEGVSQAEKLAENFPVTHIDRVYSSNLKRAYITGEIIAKKFNVPIIKDKSEKKSKSHTFFRRIFMKSFAKTFFASIRE